MDHCLLVTEYSPSLIFFHPLFPCGKTRRGGGEGFSESISWGTKGRVILGFAYCDFDLSASSFFRSFKNSFFSFRYRIFSFFFWCRYFCVLKLKIPSPDDNEHRRTRPRVVSLRFESDRIFSSRRATRLRGNKGHLERRSIESEKLFSFFSSLSLDNTLLPLIYCLCEWCKAYLEEKGLAHLHLELS